MRTDRASSRSDEQGGDHLVGRRGGRARALAVGLAGLALGVGALAACTSSPAPPSANPGTVTVTRTTTAPAPATTSSPPSPSPPSPTSTGASTGPASGGAPASTTPPAAAGRSTCTPSHMRITVGAVPGGASAGHVQLQIVATNTGTTQCVIQGYPGVSLTAPGTGTQLGAAADRVPGADPLLWLEPGRSAVSAIRVAQAGGFGSGCGLTPAAGFRIYLPDQTAAAFAPFVIDACRSASTHQLTVAPFDS